MAEFSVCQFFEDDTYEYVRRFVGPEQALQAFRHYISSVGAQIGTTKRVIITDGGDDCVAEWKWSEGITFMSGNTTMIGRFKEGVDAAPANPS